MIVHNPNNLPTIDYRTVIPLQENLKDLHTENHDKLLHILNTRGFKQPLNLWHHEDKFYLMDGHQRQRVMTLNELSDNGNYQVPYLVTEADNIQDAVTQLLEIASDFGTPTVDGFDELTEKYELEINELDVNFDAINLELLIANMDDSETPGDDEKSKTDKVSRWTLADLLGHSKRFTEQTNSVDVTAFLEWLNTNG